MIFNGACDFFNFFRNRFLEVGDIAACLFNCLSDGCLECGAGDGCACDIVHVQSLVFDNIFTDGLNRSVAKEACFTLSGCLDIGDLVVFDGHFNIEPAVVAVCLAFEDAVL